MSWLDTIILLLLAVGLFRGFYSGAIKTAFRLVVWLVCLFVASKFYGMAVPFVAPFSDKYALQVAMAFLAVFLGVMVVLQLGLYLILKVIKFLKLSPLDRLAGAVLGVGLGLLKVLVVLSVTAPILSKFEVWQQSPLAQALLPFAPIAQELVVKTAKEVVDEFE